MRSVPLIRCLPKMSPSSSTSTSSHIATWKRSLTWTRHDFSHDLRPLLTGKIFVWLPAFLTEPGSARYSSAPSITTVWSNYQTSYNDFFEVYKSNTVTLSPIIQMVLLTSSVLSMSITWPIILRPHWSNRLVAEATVKVGHKYVNVHRHQLLISSEINNVWWWQW